MTYTLHPYRSHQYKLFVCYFFLLGWSSNITLDGSESHDPDVVADDAFDGLQYNWYCHLSNETFVPDDIDIDQELPNEGRIHGCVLCGYCDDDDDDDVVRVVNLSAGEKVYVVIES